MRKHLGANVVLDDEIAPPQPQRFAALFSREYRKRTAFNCLFFICIVMPYFAIYTFLPAILPEDGAWPKASAPR